MNREQALELMDALTGAGYGCQINAEPVPPSHPRLDGLTVVYRVYVSALRFDRVDLLALCKIAEELGLEFGYFSNALMFSRPDDVPGVIREPRAHPR